MVNVDGVFGVSWRVWGRWAAGMWLGMFVAAWASLAWGWMARGPDHLVLLGGALLAVGIANVLPGGGALVCRRARERLLTMPEAAALACLTLSAVVGIGGAVGVSLLAGGDAGMVAAGTAVGIVAFPLTFGMTFPLGIPLLSSFVVWSWIRGWGSVSRMAFAAWTAAAAAGWAGVVLIGAALGAAG